MVTQKPKFKPGDKVRFVSKSSEELLSIHCAPGWNKAMDYLFNYPFLTLSTIEKVSANSTLIYTTEESGDWTLSEKWLQPLTPDRNELQSW